MRPIKLNVRTNSDNYPLIVGFNLIDNFEYYLKKNSINFNQCLLIIDKKVPKKMISKITRSLRKKKLFKYFFNANEKNKNFKSAEKILQEKIV